MGRRRGRRALSALRADLHERCERPGNLPADRRSDVLLRHPREPPARQRVGVRPKLDRHRDGRRHGPGGGVGDKFLPYDAAAPPTELVDFAAKVPCLQASATTDAVEACLAAPAPTAVRTPPPPPPTAPAPTTVPTATAPSPTAPAPTTVPTHRAVAVAEPHHVAARPRRLRHALGSGLRRRRPRPTQRARRADAAGLIRLGSLYPGTQVEFQRDVRAPRSRTTPAALAAAVAVPAARPSPPLTASELTTGRSPRTSLSSWGPASAAARRTAPPASAARSPSGGSGAAPRRTRSPWCSSKLH